MKHILLANDHAEHLRRLGGLLRAQGYEVREARHGEEALSSARQSLPDLVISDLMMPVMDGYRLLHQWKTDARLKLIPFVIYTATYADAQDEKLALGLGADLFIPKPAEPDSLLTRLRELLDRSERGGPPSSPTPVDDTKFFLRQYSETLIRKLETKMLELEQRNRELQADIMARQQAEAALRKSEARFRAYVEQAAEAIVVHDFAGRFLDVNQQACVTLGYDREELLRLTVFDIETDFELAQAQAAWRHITPGCPTTIRGHHRRKDGSIFPVEVRFGVFDLDGQRCYVGMVRDVTERKRAEEALRESEERFRKVFEEGPLGIVMASLADGRFIRANRAVCEMLGYAEAELQRLTVAEVTHPDYRDQDAAAVLHLNEGQIQKHETEKRYLKKNGDILWGARALTKIQRADGQGFYALAMIRDITQRKQAEHRIHQLNRTYAVMSDINQLIVHERNPQALLEQVCHIAVHQGGFAFAWMGLVEETSGLLKLAASAKADPETIAVINQILATPDLGCAFTTRAMKTGTSAVCNDIEHDPLSAPWRQAALTRGYRAMGSFPLLVDGHHTGTFNLYSGEPDFFNADEVRLFNELAADISFALEVSRRERERRLIEESHARLAMAVEQADEAIFITDLRGNIIYANPAFERISGYPRAEAIGQNPRILKSGRQNAEFYRRMWEVIKRGEIWRGHFINRHKTGGLFEEEATISPIRNASGQVQNYVAVKRDVTHEMQLESQFRRAQKMEAIGTLAGGIAHDFNNILGAIFGYAHLLQQTTENLPAAQEDVAEILKAADRAKDLVQQILTFSRQREQSRQIIRLDSIIKESTKFLRASLPAEIKIDITLAEDAPAVLADPTQIYQVTVNLATNALHAMEGRPGRLAVSLESFLPDEKFVQSHPEAKPIPYARLTVSDTGIGMDARTLERIYEPFFSTKPVGKGTGLGLAVVHGIVKSHDGLITVESQVGHGTTFQLYFPAQSGPATPTEAPTGKPPGGRGQKILFLDDEIAVSGPMKRLLEGLNYQVTACNSAREAIALFGDHPKQFDLIITDLTMPDVNGIEVARQIHLIRPEVPILLFSGFAPELNQAALHAAGICGRVAKPVSVSVLAEAVQRALPAGVAL